MELVPNDYESAEDNGPVDSALTWDPETTFVVSGPLLHRTKGRDVSKLRGRVFTRAAARRWVEATYGRWEEIRHQQRWCFRVTKPTAPGGRYTPPNG